MAVHLKINSQKLNCCMTDQQITSQHMKSKHYAE